MNKGATRPIPRPAPSLAARGTAWALVLTAVLLATSPARADAQAATSPASADAQAATSPAALGRKALALLARADYAALLPSTCAPGGLSFSPYARNLASLSPVQLAADDLRRFASHPDKRIWGRYDGSGADIVLTPRAYHAQFVYDVDYQRRARATLRSPAALKADAELSALAGAYPGAGLVIYRDPGTRRNDFKDARELIMVVRPVGKRWCLQGLSHSEDSV